MGRYFESLRSLSIKNLRFDSKLLGMRAKYTTERDYTLDQEEAIE